MLEQSTDEAPGPEGLGQELESSKTGVESGRLCAGCDLLRRRCGLGSSASVAAVEVMLAEVIAQLKEVGLSVGAKKTHWTSHPKMEDSSIMVDGFAVLWEEVLEFVGSKGVCGRKREACDCTQIS